MATDIIQLTEYAEEHGASDIHLSSGMPPIVRISGHMNTLRTAALTADEVREMLFSIMSEKQRTEFEANHDIDFAIHLGEKNRYRVNAFETTRGPAAVLRTIASDIVTLADIGAPPIFERLANLKQGCVLVTGPTGSGKSTTLSAIINHINQNQAKHIITLEDPIEFIHKPQKSLVNQREIGLHTTSFASGIKSALREDPDIILVGEMRDIETIHAALTAAETGHLVFGTLHTSSAPQTIDRIIDVFPAEDKPMVRTMLSACLEAVISQRLLPRKGGSGRIAAHEILIANSAIRNLIREAKLPQILSVMQVSSRVGMQTMGDAVNKILQKGIIDDVTAKRVLNIITDDLPTSSNTSPAPAPAAKAPAAAPPQAEVIKEQEKSQEEAPKPEPLPKPKPSPSDPSGF